MMTNMRTRSLLDSAASQSFNQRHWLCLMLLMVACRCSKGQHQFFRDVEPEAEMRMEPLQRIQGIKWYRRPSLSVALEPICNPMHRQIER